MNIGFGHFQITCKSSAKVVSSSKNLKFNCGLGFVNSAENILEPISLVLFKMSNNSKS